VPTSSPSVIPVMLKQMKRASGSPKAVLDIGIGFGKWGFLIRETFEAGPHQRWQREDWRIKIEGIEVFDKYVGPHQRSIYDEIHIGNAFEVIDGLGQFDFVILGDVIEHFTKEQGHELLGKVAKHTKRILISTPLGFMAGGHKQENEHEVHKSGWVAEDFRKHGVLNHEMVRCDFWGFKQWLIVALIEVKID